MISIRTQALDQVLHGLVWSQFGIESLLAVRGTMHLVSSESLLQNLYVELLRVCACEEG
jgi:hypothetical protein